MRTLLAAVALTALALPAAAQARGAKTDCADKPLPAAAEGEAFSIDGDTIAVVGLKPHIRLWGIQAAELRQKTAIGATGIETVPGMVGRAALEDELQGADRRVFYEPTKWDKYCRIVARVWSAGKSGKTDLGSAMLEHGAAYGFMLDDVVPSAPTLGREYATAEAKARSERAGLWKNWLGEK